MLFKRGFISIFLVLSCTVARADDALRCNGEVYKKNINLWTEYIKNEISVNIIQNKLITQGNTYALYDLQIYLHDFLLMLGRCNDEVILEQLLDVIFPVFMQLETVDLYGQEKWICKSCTDKKLIGREVELYSKQYIAFLTDVVFILSKLDFKNNKHLDGFVKKAVQVTMGHLYRWSLDKDMIQHIKERIPFSAKESNGTPKYFFTDKDIWGLVALSNMAQIATDRPEWMPKDFFKNNGFPVSIIQFAQLEFELLKKRLFIKLYYDENEERNIVTADLDKGYWRLYRDYQYAGYMGNEKPLDCLTNKKMDTVFSKNDLGWDLSHMRRIVRFLEVMDRSHQSVMFFYQIDKKNLPNKNLKQAFVNQLLYKIWNKDEMYPLFSNYWDGTNGWYRVGYNDGSGKCREGVPPYGLSESFATGGFATWGSDSAIIRGLARRIFDLSLSSNLKDVEFMTKYYPNLASDEKPKHQYFKFMFFSSLIE